VRSAAKSRFHRHPAHAETQVGAQQHDGRRLEPGDRYRNALAKEKWAVVEYWTAMSQDGTDNSRERERDADDAIRGLDDSDLSPAQWARKWRNESNAEREAAVDQRERAAGRRERAVDVREQASGEREAALSAREESADRRDHLAWERDEQAVRRDDAAEERDVASAGRDVHAIEAEAEVAQQPNVSAEAIDALESARSGSESDREGAGGDRQSAAVDRSHAERDRDASAGDRHAATIDRASGFIDDLTGVLLRGPGFFELNRDIARARRSGDRLVLGFADVVGFKAINDSIGHAAGDTVLRRVADSLCSKLRPYDTIVRYGGDEFVCAVSGMSPAEVKDRLAAVNVALAEGAQHASVTVGVAELQADDSLEALLDRADADLRRQRGEGQSDSR